MLLTDKSYDAKALHARVGERGVGANAPDVTPISACMLVGSAHDPDVMTEKQKSISLN